MELPKIKGKKGAMQNVQGLIWALVLIGIFLVVGLLVMDNLLDTVDNPNSTAYQAGNTTIGAIGDIPDWLPVIVVVVIAGVIITLVTIFRRSGT